MDLFTLVSNEQLAPAYPHAVLAPVTGIPPQPDAYDDAWGPFFLFCLGGSTVLGGSPYQYEDLGFHKLTEWMSLRGLIPSVRGVIGRSYMTGASGCRWHATNPLHISETASSTDLWWDGLWELEQNRQWRDLKSSDMYIRHIYFSMVFRII